MGCWLIVFGYFVAIAVDAFIDKAKLEASGEFYSDWLAAVTPPHWLRDWAVFSGSCGGVYRLVKDCDCG
jgi:hypothetical protein